jgi:hopene-associated glycosyltransferase HpnB
LHDSTATGVILSTLATIPICIWTYLLLARGGFWRLRRNLLPTSAAEKPVTARLVAIVPARNEADVIARSISSLAKEPLIRRIVLIDDGSTDGTADAAIEAGSEKLVVLSAGRKPAGWTGKLWAMSRGIDPAEKLGPDYFLLTDADIEHGSGEIAKLVAYATARHLDLASYMVLLSCDTFAERALIPAFVFFFLKLYPPQWTGSHRHKAAGAAGGCILIRPEALRRIGGLKAISDEIIDDCALAREVKQSGGTVWMGLTLGTHSIRPYEGFSGIGQMISRNAFSQLRHSGFFLVAALAGLFVTYVLPPLLVFSRKRTSARLGAAAYGMMTAAYLPTIRFYRRSPLWAFALPAIAIFYAGATIHSALRYWLGKGGQWKGRVQDIRVGK